MSIWSRAFWKATAERAISTAAQAPLAMLGADQLGLLDVDWKSALSVAGMAGVLSVLKSIGAAKLSDGTPSLVDAEVLSPPAPHITPNDVIREPEGDQ